MSNKNITKENIINPNLQTLEDTKHAVLFVSLGLNLFVLTTWLVVSVSENSAVAITALL